MFSMLSESGVRPLDFLARLGGAERTALLAMASRRAAARGEVLFKAGTPGDFVYLLESGRIKVYHLSASGKEVVLWYCKTGEIFGLAEVCQACGRQVYAEACESSRVLTVAPDDFRNFLIHYPPAALLVNDVLASRLRSLGHLVQGLVTSDVNERVTQLLMRLAAQHGVPVGDDIVIDLRLTHQELANMIGTTRQSVNAVLNDLQRRELVLTMADRRLCIRREFFVTLQAAAPAASGRAEADGRL